MIRMHGPRSPRGLGASMAQESAMIVCHTRIRMLPACLLVSEYCTSVLNAVGILRDPAFGLQSSMRQAAAHAVKNSVNTRGAAG